MKATVMIIGLASIALGVFQAFAIPSYLFLLPIPVGVGILFFGFSSPKPLILVAIGLFLTGLVVPYAITAYLDQPAEPLEFVVEPGFSGDIQLIKDTSAGVPVKPANHVLRIYVPPSGVVRINDDSFLYRWRSYRVVDTQGTVLGLEHGETTAGRGGDTASTRFDGTIHRYRVVRN